MSKQEQSNPNADSKRQRRTDFTMIDNPIIDEYGAEIGSDAGWIYVAIARHADNETHEAWPGIQRLCEMTGLSKKTVLKNIKHMEKLGLLSVLRSKTADGDNATNVYTLLPVYRGGLKTKSGPESENRLPIGSGSDSAAPRVVEPVHHGGEGEPPRVVAGMHHNYTDLNQTQVTQTQMKYSSSSARNEEFAKLPLEKHDETPIQGELPTSLLARQQQEDERSLQPYSEQNESTVPARPEILCHLAAVYDLVIPDADTERLAKSVWVAGAEYPSPLDLFGSEPLFAKFVDQQAGHAKTKKDPVKAITNFLRKYDGKYGWLEFQASCLAQDNEPDQHLPPDRSVQNGTGASGESNLVKWIQTTYGITISLNGAANLAKPVGSEPSPIELFDNDPLYAKFAERQLNWWVKIKQKPLVSTRVVRLLTRYDESNGWLEYQGEHKRSAPISDEMASALERLDFYIKAWKDGLKEKEFILAFMQENAITADMLNTYQREVLGLNKEAINA